MNLGERLFVNPNCSLKFGGRWGQLVLIESDTLLPYKLLFEGDTIPYGFSREELLTEKEYKEAYGGE
jgi:hypothetical protein